ncbi:MAG: hypothetical protein ABSH28_21820 [Acidobacteriota bacterium]
MLSANVQLRVSTPPMTSLAAPTSSRRGLWAAADVKNRTAAIALREALVCGNALMKSEAVPVAIGYQGVVVRSNSS